MTASSSSQVGYILSSKSTASIPLTINLSSFIISIPLPIGIYQFNCYISIPVDISPKIIAVSIYIGTTELHTVNTTTGQFINYNFTYAYTNTANNLPSVGLKCMTSSGNFNLSGAFFQAIRIA